MVTAPAPAPTKSCGSGRSVSGYPALISKVIWQFLLISPFLKDMELSLLIKNVQVLKIIQTEKN